MKRYQPNELILMHGPAFDGSGRIVEREVAACDVAAYRQAGYQIGATPEIVKLREQLAATAAKEAAADAVSDVKPSRRSRKSAATK